MPYQIQDLIEAYLNEAGIAGAFVPGMKANYNIYKTGNHLGSALAQRFIKKDKPAAKVELQKSKEAAGKAVSNTGAMFAGWST